MLDKVAIYKEKTESLKKKIKKALMYPIATLVIAFIVTAILLVKVVPTFQEMFAGFGAELPAPTQFVVFISDVVQEMRLPVLALLVVLGTAFMQALNRSPKFSDRIDAVLLQAPVFGDLVHK